MSGNRTTIRLWSSELEKEIDVQLSPKFLKWYDGRRRHYANKLKDGTDEERMKLAYADFME